MIKFLEEWECVRKDDEGHYRMTMRGQKVYSGTHPKDWVREELDPMTETELIDIIDSWTNPKSKKQYVKHSQEEAISL